MVRILEFYINSGLRLKHNSSSRHGASLEKHQFIVTGGSSVSDRHWSAASLVCDALNVTSQSPPPTEILELDRRRHQLPISGLLEFWRCTHMPLCHHHRYSQTSIFLGISFMQIKQRIGGVLVDC